ncbi:MAG: NMD3-related protein [Candidatus Micrarchaeaceae archaeon]
MKYCPTCKRDSSSAKFYGEWCEHCTKEIMSRDLPSFAEVSVCRACGSIMLGSRSAHFDKTGFEAAVGKEIGHSVIIKEINQGNLHVEVLLERYGEPIWIEKEMNVRIRKMMCLNCRRKAGGYYESVFQLRGEKENIERERSRVEKFFEERGGFVSREKKVKGGIDLYLNSKAIAKEYISQHKLNTNVSKTLKGVINGKRFYVVTFAIRV